MTPSPELGRQLMEMLAKGRRALASAQRDTDAGDHDFASSRAYFGAFYAVEALLLTQDVTCSTHSGAISEFGKRFVATGLLPREFGKRIARLFRERQTGDYEFGMSIAEADAREDIDHARTIVDAAENWLAGEGYLPQSD
ncbi:MAG: HEPN domain-containing protein [Lentisphaerae bacterium]|nr:HEPN domain-containing protein [Lentisphaerota bacterium]